jgi:hypothetical protein
MTLRVAEHSEDIGWGRGDSALDFDFFGHRLILAGRLGAASHFAGYWPLALVRPW